MKVGILTARFKPDQWPLDKIIPWAGAAGIDCLEVAVPGHLDPDAILKGGGADRLRKQLDSAGVALCSLACYDPGITDPAKKGDSVARLVRTIEAAKALGVSVVCALAGFPAPGKSKMDTITQDLPGIFEPALKAAERAGVRIALENWFATCIQHLEHWDAIFRAIDHPAFGLNFDPSHLHWQGIDVAAAVRQFAPRIFHTHAKDVAIDEGKLRRVGVLERGWWRYTIPGTGRIAWGEYIGVLREIGYDGVLSIEHEDRTLDAEAGFRLGAAFLRNLIA